MSRHVERVSEDDSQLFARKLVEAIAPEESPVFDDLIESHSGKKSKRKKDNVLGFGVSAEGIAFVSPIILAISKIMWEFIVKNATIVAEDVLDDLAKEGRKSVEAKLENWVKQNTSRQAPAKLSDASLNELIASTSEQARKLGLDSTAITNLGIALRQIFQK